MTNHKKNLVPEINVYLHGFKESSLRIQTSLILACLSRLIETCLFTFIIEKNDNYNNSFCTEKSPEPFKRE